MTYEFQLPTCLTHSTYLSRSLLLKIFDSFKIIKRKQINIYKVTGLKNIKLRAGFEGRCKGESGASYQIRDQF